MLKKKRITIRDIAEKANVSHQTVSRVLNKNGYVKQKTREKIEKIIKEENYFPDPVAKSLATSRTHLIGIITATFTGNAMNKALQGAEDYSLHKKYHVIISGNEEKSKSEPFELPFFKGQRLDGLIILYHGSRNDTYKILNKYVDNIPIVSTGYASTKKNVLTVKVDSKGAAFEAVNHLINYGHSSIAVISGPKDAYETIHRNRGYQEALEKNHIDYNPEMIIEGDWFVESGYNAVNTLIQKKKKFTSIFCHSDRMAIGCIKALEENGLRVPEDIAVVGYNDIEISKYLRPSLTTVSHPLYELGQSCAKLIIKCIEKKTLSKSFLNKEDKAKLKTKLIIRESSGIKRKN